MLSALAIGLNVAAALLGVLNGWHWLPLVNAACAGASAGVRYTIWRCDREWGT